MYAHELVTNVLRLCWSSSLPPSILHARGGGGDGENPGVVGENESKRARAVRGSHIIPPFA